MDLTNFTDFYKFTLLEGLPFSLNIYSNLLENIDNTSVILGLLFNPEYNLINLKDSIPWQWIKITEYEIVKYFDPHDYRNLLQFYGNPNIDSKFLDRFIYNSDKYITDFYRAINPKNAKHSPGGASALPNNDIENMISNAQCQILQKLVSKNTTEEHDNSNNEDIDDYSDYEVNSHLLPEDFEQLNDIFKGYMLRGYKFIIDMDKKYIDYYNTFIQCGPNPNDVDVDEYASSLWGWGLSNYYSDQESLILLVHYTWKNYFNGQPERYMDFITSLLNHNYVTPLTVAIITILVYKALGDYGDRLFNFYNHAIQNVTDRYVYEIFYYIDNIWLTNNGQTYNYDFLKLPNTQACPGWVVKRALPQDVLEVINLPEVKMDDYQRDVLKSRILFQFRNVLTPEIFKAYENIYTFLDYKKSDIGIFKNANFNYMSIYESLNYLQILKYEYYPPSDAIWSQLYTNKVNLLRKIIALQV